MKNRQKLLILAVTLLLLAGGGWFDGRWENSGAVWENADGLL